MQNLNLYRDLLVTVIKSRMTMDTASARADILLNIFFVNVERLGKEESFVERVISHLELDLLDSRDASENLRNATADMARAVWACRKNPTSAADQNVREMFEHWEAVYHGSIGEYPAETYMDIENARCRVETDYYSEPPLPFISRAQAKKFNQN